MKTQGLAMAVCAVMAACGGGGGAADDNPPGNAAVDRMFDYGGATPASATQARVLQTGITNVVSLRAVPSAASALALASLGSVTSTLLGSSPTGLLVTDGWSKLTAMASGGQSLRADFDPGCITITQTTITYANCRTTTDTSSTLIDGSFTISADGRSLTWDLTLDSDVNTTGATSSIQFHESGTVTVTDSTIKGDMLAEAQLSYSGGGVSVAYGMSEALILDITYQSSPPCVTGGTLEARRVWTERPSGVPEGTLPDRAVKIVWTGCNQATIASST
jgi:hypothetical protein